MRDSIAIRALARIAAPLLVLVMLSGCASQSHRRDALAIQDVLSSQAAAWNRGDIVAFMDGYERSDALVFTSGGAVRRGFDATLERYRKAYVEKGRMGQLTFELVETRFVGSDAAVVLGKYHLTETPKAGTGLFTLVFIRTADGWRCIHDHTSAAPRPKPALPQVKGAVKTSLPGQ